MYHRNATSCVIFSWINKRVIYISIVVMIVVLLNYQFGSESTKYLWIVSTAAVLRESPLNSSIISFLYPLIIIPGKNYPLMTDDSNHQIEFVTPLAHIYSLFVQISSHFPFYSLESLSPWIKKAISRHVSDNAKWIWCFLYISRLASRWDE